jgi:Zn-dependent membrane protease YugP
MEMRSKIVPVVNICSQFWHIVFVIGLTMVNTPIVANIGIYMFMAVVLFQIVTLPTELNASYRAMRTLEGQYILEADEVPKAKKVLTAAAMTYVTALVTSLLHLLTLVMRVRGNDD